MAKYHENVRHDDNDDFITHCVVCCRGGSAWRHRPSRTISAQRPARGGQCTIATCRIFFGRIGWEIADIGKELDRVRSEAQVLTAAAALEQWIIASRNSARSSGVMPMPPALRRALGNFYDEQIYDMVAFKIGGSAPLNLADLAMRYGDADAVTLDRHRYFQR